MNKNLHIVARRFFLVALMMVGGLLGVNAANKLVIEPFSLVPGTKDTIPVILTNSDNVSSIQMDITVPYRALTLDVSRIIRNEERIDRETHAVTCEELSSVYRVSTTYRLMVMTNTGDAIAGNDGAIVYLPISAGNVGYFYEDTTIAISNVRASYNAKPVELSYEPTVIVSPIDHIVTTLAEDTLSLRPDSKTAQSVNLDINSKVDVYSMEFEIALPQGVSIVKKEGKDTPNFTYGAALSQNMTIRSSELASGNLKVVVSSATADVFTSREGNVLSFQIVADTTLAATAELSIENMIVTSMRGGNYVPNKIAGDTVSLINAKMATLDPVMAQVNVLVEAYQAAVDTINAVAPDVKDSALIADQLTAIETSIDALIASVEAAYEDNTLTENLETILAPMASISEAIEKVLVDAKAAQAAYEEKVAEEAKKAANEAAYKTLSAQIAEAQAALDAANDSIAVNCKDVAADYAETAAALQADIDTLSSQLEAQYKAVELTAESTIDTESIEIAISKMLTDALAAQKAIDDAAAEAAKKAANEEAYTALSAELAEVQAALDAANDTIAAQAKDVAADYAETAAALQADIDTLSSQLEAQYKAVELTAESTIDTESIETAVAKMVADALAAQAAYEENLAAEEAKKAANEEAYTALSAELAEAQAALDAANDSIVVNCKDVAADYAETAAGLQANIDTLASQLEAQYEAVELTAESTINTEAIEVAIAKMIADAVAAQEAYDVIAEEEAKKLANEEAYKALSAELAEAQAALDSAVVRIAEEAKDVAANYTMTADIIQNTINSLKNNLTVQYEAGELTAESTLDTESVQSAIAKMLSDALSAQAAYEEKLAEEAKKAANEAAYQVLSAQMAEVQALLDSAKLVVAADAKDVVADFAEQTNAIQSTINALNNNLNAQYKAVALTEESAIDTKEVEDAIAKLIVDALAAQKAYEEAEAAKKAANETAYKALTAQIASVQAVLDAAKTRIATDCKDVAAQFDAKIAEFQAEINALTTSVEDAYKNVELTAESSIETESIVAAIMQLMADALAAQEEYNKALGIEGVTADTLVDVYNLQGMKVATKMAFGELNTLDKGIYIVNGKKIAIK